MYKDIGFLPRRPRAAMLLISHGQNGRRDAYARRVLQGAFDYAALAEDEVAADV
jgi:hypothetical protein